MFATGCGPEFERLDFTFRTIAPPGVTVAYEGITIPAGLAVGLIVAPLDDSGDEMDEETRIDLGSANSGIIGIDPAIEERAAQTCRAVTGS